VVSREIAESPNRQIAKCTDRSWFTIVIAGAHMLGIRQFTRYFMRWRVRAIAYLMLLVDEYPPFSFME
jgi:Domain of unknown function (DUF4389)